MEGNNEKLCIKPPQASIWRSSFNPVSRLKILSKTLEPGAASMRTWFLYSIMKLNSDKIGKGTEKGGGS